MINFKIKIILLIENIFLELNFLLKIKKIKIQILFKL